MYKVKKRNEEIVDFQLEKIQTVIKKAFKSTETPYDTDLIRLLALQTTSYLSKNTSSNLLMVEEIQDAIEHILNQTGFDEVSKSFILYRDKRKKLRENNLNYSNLVNAYLDNLD